MRFLLFVFLLMLSTNLPNGHVFCFSEGLSWAANREDVGPSRLFRQKSVSGTRSPSMAGMKKDWGSSVDTTSGAPYLTPLAKQIVIEMNKVRSDPAGYARIHLSGLRKNFVGNRLVLPGKIPLVTKEGVKAVDECFDFLIKQKPKPVLTPKKGLTLAARDHVLDQGKTGDFGHTGSDKSTLGIRLNRYGEWGVRCAENISYGIDEAGMIVSFLLIDDGVKSRTHRANIMDGIFRYTGVAFGPHPKLRNVCVIVFAGDYKDK
jgi:uncharacterized protein YkwD